MLPNFCSNLLWNVSWWFCFCFICKKKTTTKELKHIRWSSQNIRNNLYCSWSGGKTGFENQKRFRLSGKVSVGRTCRLQTAPVPSVFECLTVNADLFCRALWVVDKRRKHYINAVHQPFMSEVLLYIWCFFTFLEQKEEIHLVLLPPDVF